ncbi:MAG: tetratricopeptide repeat protein [Flavisolibacter sp.]
MSKLMHHRIILFLSCLQGLFFYSYAQTTSTKQHIEPAKIPPAVQSEIDSLNTLLQKTPEGTEKIRLYGKICWSYLGVAHLARAGKYADSVNFLSHKLRDSQGIIKSIYYYGVLGRTSGDYAAAHNYLNQYIQYYEKRGDSSRVAAGLYQIGSVHTGLGNYDKGLAAYYRLIAIEQKDGNDYSVGYTLNAIGTILKETQKFQDAEKIFKKALYIFDTLDAKNDKTNVLVNLGNLYTQMGQFENAKQSYLDALRIDREIGKETGIALSLANMGFLFDKMGRYDSALAYHIEALTMRQNLPNKEFLSRSFIGVGLGYSRLKNYDSAKYYLIKGLSIANEITSKPILRDIYKNLAEVSASEKQFSQAYNYHLLYSKYKDSILSEQTARQLNELQTKYETGEKDKQIILLAKEKQVQEKEALRQATLKKAFIVGLLLISVLTILLVYIFRQRLRNQQLLSLKNNEIKEVNFKRQMSELEMKALRAQINPHFLFNCMNSINRMILKGETENASSYLTKFSKLVRLILENAESQTVSLENELALLESYIQLEELRFKGKINYNISIDEAIEPESTYLPSMVLQPFVENAIWHGLMHKEEDGQGNISIAVKEKNDRLFCIIEDNGVGREKAQQLREKSVLKGRSMGMKITEDRLRLLNQENTEPIIWITDLKDIMDHPTGTRVEINIPIS